MFSKTDRILILLVFWWDMGYYLLLVLASEITVDSLYVLYEVNKDDWVIEDNVDKLLLNHTYICMQKL